jgi:hypothetical protein
VLKNILSKLRKLGEVAHVDVEKFNDPVASKTSWDPLKKGGTNFRTRVLVKISQDRVEFKPSFFAVIFYLIFTTVGLGLLGYSIYALFQSSFAFENHHLILIGMGVVFFSIGTILAYYGTRPIVFDKISGYFWKGQKRPNQYVEYQKPDLFVGLKDIHALQIISEYVRSDKSSYYSYELNLVLENGNRINVVDHGRLIRLREDVEKLSEFLNKPIWDIAG